MPKHYPPSRAPVGRDKLSQAERRRLEQLIDSHGEVRAASHLGVSRLAMLRGLAGRELLNATGARLRGRLGALPALAGS